MRDDIVEIAYADMEPGLKALIAYEPNGALDIQCPQAVIERIRRESPVVRWELGVGFFTMDDIVAAGRNPVIVSTNPATGVPFGMGSRDPLIPLHVDGEQHRRFRKLLDPLFAPKTVAPMAGEVTALANELIDDFIADGHVELFERYCVPLPCTFFVHLFGMPMDDYEFLIAMKDRILKNAGQTLEEKEQIGIETGDVLRERLRQRLDECRSDPRERDDLIAQFIRWEIDGERLTDDEIVNIMHLFTIAGLDTVTSSLSCILGWLATHPDERRQIVADPSRLPAAIEELLRYESPVPSSGARWAVEDTDVNGVAVKAGELLYFCWAAGNLDSAAFPDPLSVVVDRAENRHIAFAAGTHRCLGSHLARLELRCAIEALHRRIPDYWITSGEAERYEFAGVRQVRSLPLTFTAS